MERMPEERAGTMMGSATSAAVEVRKVWVRLPVWP
jgi:hypothetical protein